MKFLDSNILIYAADELQSGKYERACDILDAAIRGNGFVISAQVLNEFASEDLGDGQTYCGIKAVNPFRK